MTNPIGFDEIRILAKQTQHLPPETWRTTQWSGDILRARDGFMQLVHSHSSEVFNEFKDHPFWLNWASKSSLLENNILYFAISGSSDPLWIERLSAAGVSAPPHFIPRVRNQKAENVVPVLKVCEKLGFIHLSENAEYQSLFRYFCSRGSEDFLNYMWDNGLFNQRFNGIENELSVFENKKLFRGSRVRFLTKLWGKWGVPPSQELRKLFSDIQNYALSGNSSRGTAYQYVASHWNYKNSEWTEYDSKLLLKSFFKKGPSEPIKQALREYIHLNVFSENVWNETLEETAMKNEWNCDFNRIYLEGITSHISSVKRIKRM